MNFKLFNVKTDKNVKLVDNKDFIEWASIEPNPAFKDTLGAEGIYLNDGIFDEHWAAEYFLKEKGATPIDSSDKLFESLTAMFYWRADLGLEIARIYRNLDDISYAFGDLSTCTKETREYG